MKISLVRADLVDDRRAPGTRAAAAAIHLRSLAEALIRAGHDVQIWCASGPDRPDHSFAGAPLRTIDLPSGWQQGPRSALGAMSEFGEALPRAWSTDAPDVVHSFG